MKVWHVYELVNSNGIVEYVGETINPEQRLYQHTKKTPAPGRGKFYKRTDITMKIISKYNSKLEAYREQLQLQKYHNLSTDAENISKSLIGKEKSLEHKLKLAKSSTGNKNCIGRFMSEETRNKIKNTKLGKSNGREGKTHSVESKQKMKEARLKYLQNKNI